MEVTVTIKGDAELARKLRQFGSGLLDFKAEMDQIGDDLVGFYATVPFVSEGGIYGQRWRPLNPRYELWKAKRYPGRNILVRTARMQRSFAFQPTTTALKVFNRAPYFKYHQTGQGVPKRTIMALERTRKAAIARIIGNGLVRKLRRAA